MYRFPFSVIANWWRFGYNKVNLFCTFFKPIPLVIRPSELEAMASKLFSTNNWSPSFWMFTWMRIIMSLSFEPKLCLKLFSIKGMSRKGAIFKASILVFCLMVFRSLFLIVDFVCLGHQNRRIHPKHLTMGLAPH